MFKWLSKIFGSKPTPSRLAPIAFPLPANPEAVQQERNPTTETVAPRASAPVAPSKSRAGSRITKLPEPSRSSSLHSYDNARRRDSYTDDSLLNPLNPLSPVYVGNSYADSAPSESYSSRSETCSPSSSYDSSSSSSSYDSGSSSDSGSCSSSD